MRLRQLLLRTKILGCRFSMEWEFVRFDRERGWGGVICVSVGARVGRSAFFAARGVVVALLYFLV